MAGLRAVNDAMKARRRDSPTEVTEVWLKIAIAQALLREIRMARRPIRVFDELKAKHITNIQVGRGEAESHPVDIALLHPLMDTEGGQSDWSREMDALGLIEVKKHYGRVEGDAKWLDKLKRRPEGKQ